MHDLQKQIIVKKPKRWIVIVLALLHPTFAFLYIGKGLIALSYFIGTILIVVLGHYHANFQIGYLVLFVVGILHSLILAKNTTSSWKKLHPVLYVTAIILFFWLLIRLLFINYYQIPAQSMAPNIVQGDYIVMKRWGWGYFNQKFNRPYDIRQLNRGDIIVFDYPLNPSISYIKRVAALPGDTISFYNGKLILNHKVIENIKVASMSNIYETYYLESFGADKYLIRTLNDAHLESMQTFMNSCPLVKQNHVCTVPANSLFVLGDNRDQSADSRYWGYVPTKNISGKVIWISSSDQKKASL